MYTIHATINYGTSYLIKIKLLFQVRVRFPHSKALERSQNCITLGPVHVHIHPHRHPNDSEHLLNI